MDDTTILGGVLGQVGLTAKKAGQQIVKLPEEVSRDLGEQIGGTKPAASTKPDLVSGEPKQKQWQSDEERIKFLKDLYGSSEKTSSTKQTSPIDSQDKFASFAKASAAKPEEQKELTELRDKLHREVYYDPTFNPVKKQEEERPAEKVEQEKKQEMQDLQQKDAKKPPPLAVVREQNKAEMFRGAAG